jgi:hypothetical protein
MCSCLKLFGLSLGSQANLFNTGFAHKVTFAKGPSSLCKRGMQGVNGLKGVEIEKEKLKPGKKTFEKGKSSKLGTFLLLSAATCRWLAEQAMLDGCTHPGVCDVAKAGCHGLYPGNVHRDLMARFVKGVFVPEPMQVPVPNYIFPVPFPGCD